MQGHRIKSLRDEIKYEFLKNYFQNIHFEIFPLPGDASFRTYERIIAGEQRFILMNSPPEHYSLTPFINIAEFLRKESFSAPNIYHSDHINGFMLLEDFGSKSIANYLNELTDLTSKERIYKLIIELLIKLQFTPPPSNLEVYDIELLIKDLEIFTDWYVPFKTGIYLNNEQKNEFVIIWEEILKKLPPAPLCVVLRDYHVENMMLLKREGINSIGLLDFQDAIIGHPLYDVVSVLEDARIEVNKDFGYKFLDYYLSLNDNLTKNDGYISYHILAAHRNSRILGVFARKAIRDGQNNYLKYMPRVLNYLDNDLSHPVLTPVKNWINDKL